VSQGAVKDDVPILGETGFVATGFGFRFDKEGSTFHAEGLALSSCRRVVAEGVVFIS
jgi:hypothetical protein